MRIVSIHLKNIKSHRDTELSFSSGINVLAGPNGAGKSTIFEAIGYALFGVSAQDFVSKAERFLSIGAKRGEISVIFHSLDGELYRVTRSVGAAGKWLLAKKQGDDFEVEEHANLEETEVRIASLLGLSGGRSLADQFKLVIGPFQNDFLGPFVIKQPTRRQDAFDEILGIDGWRKTFDGTKTLAAAIQGRTETLKAEVAGREEQVAALPARVEELKVLKAAEQEKQAALAQGKDGLAAVTTHLAAFEAEQRRLDLLRAELKTLEERIASGKEHVASQQLQVEKSQVAAAVLGASRAGKNAYDAAEERLKGLRSEEQAKLGAERAVAEVEKELAGVVSALEIETRELAELGQAISADDLRLSRQMLEQTEAVAELQGKEALARNALRAAEEALDRFRALPLHLVEGTLPYLLAGLERLGALEEEAREKHRVVAAKPDIQREALQVASLKATLEEVQGKKSQLMGRRLGLVEGKEKLSAGECPYFGEACRNLAANEAADPFAPRLERLDLEMEKLDRQAADLGKALTAAQAAERELVGIEQAAKDLERISEEKEKVEREIKERMTDIDFSRLAKSLDVFLVTAASRVAKIPAVIPPLDETGTPDARRERLKAWGAAVNALRLLLEKGLEEELRNAEAPVQTADRKKVELQGRGGELGRFQEELSGRKEKATSREKGIKDRKERLCLLRTQVERMREELSRYAGLGEKMAQSQKELERFLIDRDRYIANEKAAQEMENRLELLSKYQRRLQELQGAHADMGKELDVAAKGYLPKRHEAAKREWEEMLSRQAALEAELSATASNLRRVEGEVTTLNKVAEEVRQKLAAVVKLGRQAEMVKLLRNQVFKNVSSQLSERFREEISSRADRIYRSIAESDEELVWGENYQVVLKDLVEGVVRERSDDQLSGGQMMSAVVALRLALLQTIGARIAFFDEPTSNLDAERRENLARAFRAIDVGQEEVTEHWYDQLFLVSHDVSFTEITDQIIHLGGD